MEISTLVIVAGLVLVYALASTRLTALSISGPMVFLLLGLLVGDDGLGWVQISADSSVVRGLAQFTLVIILFSDAARIDVLVLRRNAAVPARLLGIGLPLTILGGMGAAYLLFDGIDLWGAALLAAVLAPTDAALCQPILSNEDVPVRIRQALNVESGLNDGMVVPFITLFTAGAVAAEGIGTPAFWAEFALKQVAFGVFVGVFIGMVSGFLIKAAVTAGWMGKTFRQISLLAVALGAFGAAELVEGNGFIAAFVAGLAVGNVTRVLHKHLFEFAEEEGQLFVLLTFFLFGAVFVGATLEAFTWQVGVYALLSLTVVRMLPVALSLIGVHFRADTVMMLGWFGPRGLASLVFALDVLEDEIPDGRLIFEVAAVTVVLSAVVHGLSAQPLVRWYGSRADEMAEEPDLPEMKEVPELPTRSPNRNRHWV